MTPIVTVLLPVWNCEQYVGAAIESILSQTCEDFEFLIIDDGSTDETPSVLKRYSDPRIRHIRHANMGLAGTLNVGIDLARGRYIARQDQDDISLPQRFERQFAYLEENPDCGLLGTWAQIMEGDRLAERFHRHPADPSLIRYQLLLNNPFVHSSVMLRKCVLDAVGGYSTDSQRQPPEDYELWSRIARRAEVANLPELLLYYREIPGSMSRNGTSPFKSKLVRLCSENIALAAGVGVGNQSATDIAAITHGAGELASARPDFLMMEKIFLGAVCSVVGDHQQAEILVDAKNRIRSMRAAHLLARSPLRDWISHQTPLRTFLKAIFRSVLRINQKTKQSVESQSKNA